jgi:Polyketide cyclase / dehydrase and lipid transport
MLAESTVNGASSADVRAIGKTLPLRRGVFPRPYSLTRLPHRDITMQNVLGEGDFEHYQGVWRMQSLPNCAPNGGNASRLTYAVEIKPKGILPVRLIEGRIASDLKANMAAIRNFVEAEELKKPQRILPKDIPSEHLGTIVEPVLMNPTGIQDNSLVDPTDAAHPIQSDLIITDRQRGSKRRSIMAALSRLFSFRRGSKGNNQSRHAAESLSQSAEFSPSAIVSSEMIPNHLGQSDKPAEVTDLLEENARLKEKVASLEGEMRKAKAVLKKIEILSKVDT